MRIVLLTCALLIALTFCHNVSAQNNNRTIKEKTINGTTYMVEQWGTGKDNYTNKNGKFEQFTKEWGKYCTDFYLTDQDALSKDRKDVVKSVFSDVRIKQLSKDNTSTIAVSCICNRDGEIKAVRFSRVQSSLITISEIRALEDAYLKMKVSIDCHLCPDTKYFIFHFPIRFKDNL